MQQINKKQKKKNIKLIKNSLLKKKVPAYVHYFEEFLSKERKRSKKGALFSFNCGQKSTRRKI